MRHQTQNTENSHKYLFISNSYLVGRRSIDGRARGVFQATNALAERIVKVRPVFATWLFSFITSSHSCQWAPFQDSQPMSAFYNWGQGTRNVLAPNTSCNPNFWDIWDRYGLNRFTQVFLFNHLQLHHRRQQFSNEGRRNLRADRSWGIFIQIHRPLLAGPRSWGY